jgi:hypothetical protein
MESAPRVLKRRSNGKIIAAIVSSVIPLLTVTFLLRQTSTIPSPSTVTISGTAVTTDMEYH